MSAKPAGEEWAPIDTLTPQQAQEWLTWAHRRISSLREEILAVQKSELTKKHEFEAAVRRVALADDTPKIRRGENGVSKDLRDAFIDRATHQERQAYEIEKVTREAAQEFMKTLDRQSMIAMHLSKTLGVDEPAPTGRPRWAGAA